MKDPWDGTPIHYEISLKNMPRAKSFVIHDWKDCIRYGHSVDIPCVECGTDKGLRGIVEDGGTISGYIPGVVPDAGAHS